MKNFSDRLPDSAKKMLQVVTIAGLPALTGACFGMSDDVKALATDLGCRRVQLTGVKTEVPFEGSQHLYLGQRESFRQPETAEGQGSNVPTEVAVPLDANCEDVRAQLKQQGVLAVAEDIVPPTMTAKGDVIQGAADTLIDATAATLPPVLAYKAAVHLGNSYVKAAERTRPSQINIRQDQVNTQTVRTGDVKVGVDVDQTLINKDTDNFYFQDKDGCWWRRKK